MNISSLKIRRLSGAFRSRPRPARPDATPRVKYAAPLQLLVAAVVVFLALAEVRAAGGESLVAELWPPPGGVDDPGLRQRLQSEGEALLRQGKTVELSQLQRGLANDRCTLERLVAAAGDELPTPELYDRCSRGVLVVAGLYKCLRCGRYHVRPASGFVLTEDGALVTSYHVVQQTDVETLIVMDRSGRVAPVRRVLAANRQTDLAILEAGGSGYTPLPLSPDEPVGRGILVISHPQARFYVLTDGLISRYFRTETESGPSVTRMGITAEYAGGSSGAPVLNQTGAVVGVVSGITSLRKSDDHEGPAQEQMLMRNCIPARHILELITR